MIRQSHLPQAQIQFPGGSDGAADWLLRALERGWWRLRWWSPEGRAWRAFRRHSPAVVEAVANVCRASETEVEDAVQQAFLALHLYYVGGRDIPDVPAWATRYALTVLTSLTPGSPR